MTSKEKAKELVEKFIPYNQEYQEGTDMCFSDDIDGAKQCALICIEQEINLLEKLNKLDILNKFYEFDVIIAELKEVENEINKL